MAESTLTIEFVVESECSRIVQDDHGNDKPGSDLTLAVDPNSQLNKALFVLAPNGRLELAGMFLKNYMATQRIRVTLEALPPNRC